MAVRAGKDKTDQAPAPASPALTVVEGGKVAGPAPPNRQERAALRLRKVAEMRPTIAQLDAAKASVKAIQKTLTGLRNAYKREGFSLKVLDEMLENEAKPRRDVATYEVERREAMEDLGQAVYEQPDLIERLPQEKRDEKYWEEEGYQAGIMNREAKPPPECPERFVQTWLKARVAGRERVAWAQAESGINPEHEKNPNVAIGSQVPVGGDEDDDDGSPEALRAAAAARAEETVEGGTIEPDPDTVPGEEDGPEV